MEIIIKKVELQKGVNKVARAVSNKAVVPVLTGIKLEAKEGKLTMIGSDSTVSIQTTVSETLSINKDGGIVLPAKEFTSIVKSLPEGDVNIEVSNNNKAEIKAGKSKFNLNGTDVGEYPLIKAEKATNLFTTEAALLVDAIRKTIFAVSKLETRPVLTGINFSNHNNVLVAVATDSHRLSKNRIDVDVDFEDDFTIPVDASKEITTLFKDEETLSVSKTTNNLSVEGQDTIVMTRLVSGNYPDTTKLIPQGGDTVLKINRPSFIESLERAKILAKEDKTVSFEISDKNKGIFDTIKLLQQDPEVGVSEEEIVVNEVDGEELEVSFNVDYTIEALKGIDGDDVTIAFNGAMKPFTIVDDNNDNGLQLILPVRRY